MPRILDAQSATGAHVQLPEPSLHVLRKKQFIEFFSNKKQRIIPFIIAFNNKDNSCLFCEIIEQFIRFLEFAATSIIFSSVSATSELTFPILSSRLSNLDSSFAIKPILESLCSLNRNDIIFLLYNKVNQYDTMEKLSCSD